MGGVGVDVGSITTKAVVLGEDGVAARALLPTGNLPHQAAGQAYRRVLAEAGGGAGWPVVVTGYGRLDVPFAARRVTEITCHAAGVHLLFPAARTVVDVGGQDSKVIGLDPDGRVRDFAMNDRCAAGTGRFLEVMAGVLGVEVGQLGPLAEGATRELTISNLCTVFAESEVISHLARGIPREDVAAALHRAIARRVHGLAGRVGLETEVAFTGGVALNRGVAGELARLVGRPLLLPEEPQFTGALGAALLAARGPGEPPCAGCGSARALPTAPSSTGRACSTWRQWPSSSPPTRTSCSPTPSSSSGRSVSATSGWASCPRPLPSWWPWPGATWPTGPPASGSWSGRSSWARSPAWVCPELREAPLLADTDRVRGRGDDPHLLLPAGRLLHLLPAQRGQRLVRRRDGAGVVPGMLVAGMAGPALGWHIPFTLLALLAGAVASMAGPNVKALLMNVNLPENRGAIASLFALTDSIGRGAGLLLGGRLAVRRGLGWTLSSAVSFWLVSALVWPAIAFTAPRDVSLARATMAGRARAALGGRG